MSTELDVNVVVMGAGVVGCAIARELARYDLNVIVVEQKEDVGMGTSKASTAIWHTGFDAKPGSLESKLLHRSFPLLDKFMTETGVPVERLGAILVAWNDEQLARLPELEANARTNGVDDTRILSEGEVREVEPNLGPAVKGGLLVEREGILCTFTLPIALATQAAINGVSFSFNRTVEGLEPTEQGWLVKTDDGDIATRFVVNSAGLYSDEIDRMAGHDRYTVVPRKGQLLVFDKEARPLLSHVILPVPTATTKGVLVSPTVYGNILLGPTAEDQESKMDRSNTASGMAGLIEKGANILPELMDFDVTATYAGLRAATEHSDYQIYIDEGYVSVGGIRSTGISASLGIAEYVVELLNDAGLETPLGEGFVGVSMPNIGTGIRPHLDAAAIEADPGFARMVCHCEKVSRSEIENSLDGPIPATELDGVRRRTRALQGRCQGFNCMPDVVSIVSNSTGKSPAEIMGLKND